MSLEEKVQVANEATFWDEIGWDEVHYNKIDKTNFLKIKSVNKKLFAVFLGSDNQRQFFLFKPLSWGKYKDIRAKNLDKDTTHEYIISSCLVWPQTDPIFISNMDAGIMLTLVNQILTVSNFIKDINKALELIFELE